MPKPIDPSSTYPIVLDCDESKPLAKRPAFIVRVLSLREWRKLIAAYETNDDSRVDNIQAEVTAALVGWKNMDREFDRQALEDIIGPHELVELATKMISNGELSAEEKKRQESQASCNSECSAETAAPENA